MITVSRHGTSAGSTTEGKLWGSALRGLLLSKPGEVVGNPDQGTGSVWMEIADRLPKLEEGVFVKLESFFETSLHGSNASKCRDGQASPLGNHE